MRPPSSTRPTDGSTALEALRRAAAADPEAVALSVDRGARLTYAGWERRSRAVAAGLRQAVEPGARLALLFDAAHWTDYAMAYVAVHKAGAAAVPLLAGTGAVELARNLRDGGTSALIASPELAPSGISVPVLDLAELEVEGGTRPSTELEGQGSAPAPGRGDLLYRSRPLGPSAPLLWSPAHALEHPLPLLHAFPPGTVFAQEALWGCLDAVGAGSLVLAAFDAERMCALIEAAPERACALHPATAEALLRSGAAARHDVSRLSRLVLASGRASARLLTALEETFPRAELVLVDLPGVDGPVYRDRSRPGALGRAPDRDFRGDERPRRDPSERPPPADIVETVSAVFSRVLARRDVPADRDFFELGGDTGAAAAVLRLLEDAFGVRAPARALLKAPTVVELAREVQGLRAPAASAPEPDAVAPAAFSQEGMLWHELFAPGCQNLPGLARRYRGPLDVAALTRALDEIVRRHAALRTGFELRHGRLVQVVRPHRPLELEIRDLSDASASEREDRVARTVAQAGRRPFDLALDPLFVPTLLRLGDEDHVLVIRTHHSVFDDWSVGVFRRQLAKLYAAYAAGEPSPLPEPPLQFGDFSRRQRALLAGPAGTRELSFWRAELAGAPLTTQLPVEDPRAPAGSPQAGGETVALELGRELHGSLRELARRERATVFMTLLAAFGVLVRRFTAQEDLLLSTVVANRNRTELEGLIGCFTKKVPLRLRLEGDPTFTEALARTRTALLGALAHQDLPFEGVLQDVLGAAAAAHGLVPHVVLMFQGVTPRQELVLEGVESAGLDSATRAGRAHFMAGGEESEAEPAPPPWGDGLYAGTFVILSVEESETGISCTARGAFHAPAVRALMERFETLLASVAADPNRRISELALLDPVAEAEAVERGRASAHPPPADSLPGALRAQIERDPEAVAVRTGREALTYAQLDERAEALGARLRAAGAGPGARVGTALGASLELIVAVLAIWKAGAAWCGFDPGEGAERRRHIVREAALGIVIDGELELTLEGARAAPAASGMTSALRGHPGDIAVVFYGSGASAADHGVALEHRSLLNLLTALRHALPRSRHACLCPSPTDGAFLRRMVALLDGEAVYVPERPLREDPAEAFRLLAGGEVDLIDGAADELEGLLRAGLAHGLPEGSEAVVVLAPSGGVAPELGRALRRARGVDPHVLYGPPESGFGATAGATTSRGVGRPVSNTVARVLDPHGRSVPVGAVGELHLGGESLARGYLGDPDPAPGRFATLAGERLFATGELARLLSDGTVELLGATDDDRGLRGFRVEPARVEAALASVPGLSDIKVVLEREGGELVAYADAVGAAPTLARVRAHVWERLPGYALPARLVIRGATTPVADGPASELPEESILSALWADELGLEGMAGETNYWQVFSIFGALAAAREAGLPIVDEDVTRNRTLATLATAMAAVARRRRGGGRSA